MDNQKIKKIATGISDGPKDDSNKDATIFLLNEDCMRHIFSFLLIKERIKIQRVCKKWQYLSRLPWNDIKELEVSFESKSERQRIIYTLPILKQVLRNCGSSLGKLELGCVREKGFTKSFFMLIKKMCPNLKSLDIRNIALTSKTAEFLAENFQDLTSIAIGYNNRAGCHKSFPKLFSSSKCLKSVTFECSFLVDKCFAKLPANLIESLTINGGCSAEKMIKDLANFTNLRSLSLESYGNVVDDFDKKLQVLPVKTNLECLYLKAEKRHGQKNFLSLNSICYFTNLRRLSLRESPILYNDVLGIVGKSCKYLSYLALSDSSRVTDAGLQLLSPLMNLETLVVQFLKNITETPFALMQMPSLNTFSCYYCHKIDVNQAMRLLMLGSQNLRQIDFVTMNDMNLNVQSIVEEASNYTENRLSNQILKLRFHNKYLPETLHISKYLKLETQNSYSDSSDDEK